MKIKTITFFLLLLSSSLCYAKSGDGLRASIDTQFALEKTNYKPINDLLAYACDNNTPHIIPQIYPGSTVNCSSLDAEIITGIGKYSLQRGHVVFYSGKQNNLLYEIDTKYVSYAEIKITNAQGDFIVFQVNKNFPSTTAFTSMDFSRFSAQLNNDNPEKGTQILLDFLNNYYKKEEEPSGKKIQDIAMMVMSSEDFRRKVMTFVNKMLGAQ